MPIKPSSRSRLRQRIGESGDEPRLAASIPTGLKSRTVKPRDLTRATIDTTEKAVRLPPDRTLPHRTPERRVKLRQHNQLKLSQT